MLFGLLASFVVLGLWSGRSIPAKPDLGFNPGEQVPSIVVDGNDLGEALANEPNAILVLWSVDDASSRVANAMVSNKAERTETKTPVYSVCIDANKTDAILYAGIDGANTLITPYGLRGEEKRSAAIRRLVSRGSGHVYYTSNGMIEKVISTETLLDTIQ